LQEWEYLEVYLRQAEPGQGAWMDSQGRSGKMLVVDAEGAPFRWNSTAGALNALGSEGWELVGAVPAGNNHRLFLKRQVRSTGASAIPTGAVDTTKGEV